MAMKKFRQFPVRFAPAEPSEARRSEQACPKANALNTPDVAVVMAGGQSRRLGRDKAALLVDGMTLLARTIRLAGRFCPLVAVSGRDPAFSGAPAPWFADAYPGLGPLGGVTTALARFGCACLVLSCDLPHMNDPTLVRLLQAWEEREPDTLMTTFEQAETGRIEALVAVYQPEAEPLLRQALHQGRLKLSAAIPRERRHHVVYTWAESRPFFNVNTPEDLAEWRNKQRRANP